MRKRKGERLFTFKLSVLLDSESAELLKRIADKLTEGNTSQAVRKAIRVASQTLLEQKVNGDASK